jgi:hypothetical protein
VQRPICSAIGNPEKLTTIPLVQEPLRKATSCNKKKCKRRKGAQVRPDSPALQPQRVKLTNTELECPPPTSRSKRCCHFGPQRQRGRSRSRPEQLEERDRAPSTKPSRRRWDVSSPWLPDEAHSDLSSEPEEMSKFPARTTLAPPALSNRTPFDHYKAGPAPAPRDDPYRYIHRKLGISA